jgi:hypothetical protein
MSTHLIGIWRIVSSPDFDDEYLNALEPASVRLEQAGDRLAGDYHVGYQKGTLDGRPQLDGSLLFSFEGMDDTDQVHGAGIARVQDDRLLFTLMYHQGDDYTLEGRRQS